MVLVPLLLDARKFYDDDPLEALPPPMRVEEAAVRGLSDYFDFFHNSFAHPGEQHPEPVKKGEQPPPIPARAVNTLGEVPDNSWFTNRMGSRPYTIENLLRGPGNSHAPAEGRWTIIAAKTEGVTPGFTIPRRISRISRTTRFAASITAISSRLLRTGPLIGSGKS